MNLHGDVLRQVCLPSGIPAHGTVFSGSVYVNSECPLWDSTLCMCVFIYRLIKLS